ncbi:MAG: alpha/beta hydrolase [Lysobacteraceae bacterium]
MTRTLRALLALPAALLLGACSKLFFTVQNVKVDDSSIQSVVFDSAHDLSLDVHRAKNASGKVPVVVFIHGGSWQTGTRQDYRFVGQSLSNAGMLVFVPDFRQAPQVAFPAFVEDSARAVAWARNHASQYGGDPSRIFLIGHSSGAHITAMLGTDAQYLKAVGMQPRDLAGIVGLSGPYDFLPITDPKLKPIFNPLSRWPLSQPVNFVDGDEPPFLLVQGTSDSTVRPRNTTSLAAKLGAQNEPVQVEMVEGAGHLTTLLEATKDDSNVRARVLEFVRGAMGHADAH